MLEFLGFIALIAIIFGISFTAALTGFLKILVIVAAVILALGLIIKLLESKTGAVFVLTASIVAVVLGVLMINDNYEERMSYCFGIKNELAYIRCAANASDDHNESSNKGWGYIITGSVAALISFGAWSDFDKKTKATPKKHSAA